MPVALERRRTPRATHASQKLKALVHVAGLRQGLDSLRLLLGRGSLLASQCCQGQLSTLLRLAAYILRRDSRRLGAHRGGGAAPGPQRAGRRRGRRDAHEQHHCAPLGEGTSGGWLTSLCHSASFKKGSLHI